MIELLMRRRLAEMDESVHEVEYLENNGIAYINTGYVPQGKDIRICAKFYFGGFSDNTAWLCWLYAYVADDTQCYRWMRQNTNNKIAIQMGRRGNNSLQNLVSVSAGNIYEIDANNNRYIVNGTEYVHTDYATTKLNTNILTFFDNRGKSKLRCYYFKVYKGDDLVRDMIPVRVKREGYMYDRITDQLYGNAGTGSFILGPDK